jgi:hypothetical protein
MIWLSTSLDEVAAPRRPARFGALPPLFNCQASHFFGQARDGEVRK